MRHVTELWCQNSYGEESIPFLLRKFQDLMMDRSWLYLLLLRESQLLNYRIYFQRQAMKLENSKGNSTFVT